MNPEQEKLIAILSYLEAWDKLVQTPVTSVTEYRAGLADFQKEIEVLPEIKTNFVDANGEPVWMEVPRLQKNPPPQVEERLFPWVILVDNPSVEPLCRKTIELPPIEGESKKQTILLAEDISALFGEYLARAWAKWAKEESLRRKCIAFYERIFHLQQTIENAGSETPTELVWGMGMAIWNAKGHTICHPLITQQVEIFNVAGSMSLGIRPTSAEPRIETDQFLYLEIPELSTFEAKARSIFSTIEATPSPFEPESFEMLAKMAAKQLNTTGRYLPDESNYVRGEVPQAGPSLQVTDSWVLFARRRTSNFIIQDINSLKQAIEEGIPDGAPRHLVKEPEGECPESPEIHFRGLSSTGMSSQSSGLQELFFPKPFNDEQVEIIRRLESRPGVVVQGPPGTGKTHTIANVICHYMAQGKRVLVTSKGETALSVLQAQLPEQIRNLTISLLTNEKEGKDQLERAVKGISSKVDDPRNRGLESEIKIHVETIEKLHQNIAEIDCDLRSWARKNTERAPDILGGLSPESLAREVCANEPAYNWFPDKLDSRIEHEAVSDSEMQLLADARFALKKDLEYLNFKIPRLEELPTVPEMLSIHENLCEYGKLAEQAEESSLPEISLHLSDFLSAAERLHAEAKDHIALIEDCQDGWISELRLKFRQRTQNGDHEAVLEILESLKVEAQNLHESFTSYVATAIAIPAEIRGNEFLRIAISRAAEGKRPFTLLQIGNKPAKQALERVSLNGRKPLSADDWELVQKYCHLLEQADKLSHRWNKLSQTANTPTLQGSPEECVQQLAGYSRYLDKANLLANNYDLTLEARVLQVFPMLCAAQITFEKVFLDELEDALRIQLRKHRLDSDNRLVESLKKLLGAVGTSTFVSIQKWLGTCIGNPNEPSETIDQIWVAFLKEVERLNALEFDLASVRNIVYKISKCGATNWASRLATEAVVAETDDLLPANWRQAWMWSRQCGYLEAINGRAQILKATRDRRDAELSMRREYENVVEKRTWFRLIEKLRLEPKITRAITAYMQAIRGMTKSGKGKRDVKLRYAAREAMQLASRGVPCWIMPHWRVSESLPATLSDFDLVIVDEASQSDAWALPSILRGKKVLIVGDDKQVGPTPSFMRQEQIDQIQDRLKLVGLSTHIRHRLDPKESIYDFGELLFAGHTIRLREHFRCAEPIIEFSNKLCYDREIQCVRIPNAAERMLPTLVDVHVCNGRRDPAQKINRAEASAIADEIAALTSDKKFGSRSIGVVSLLGPEQGKLIFDLVIERIGEEAFLKHKIRCGDARFFQGSEADVIFISAVDDATSGGVMTANKMDNIRRINVAVSRARDRLYFFHSFVSEDLSPLDLRVKLIEHFKAPLHGVTGVQGKDLCESNFEREMYDALCDLGYRTIPQVRAGNYRIDFVVEGHQGKRLAVECDGDRYHGPDKWMDDMARQRLLERAGWKFWRCWGSSFALDKEGCLKELIEALANEGIEPIGETEVDYSGITEFRKVGSNKLEESFEASSEVSPTKEPTSEESHELPINEDLSLDQKSQIKGDEESLNAIISVGGAVEVEYSVRDSAGLREEYVVILNQPSNWKLRIINAQEEFAKFLLGCEVGQIIETRVDGTIADIEILYKHEVVVE